MSMYDPGWHRFEPTQEEVLVELAAEERAGRQARGLQRLVRRLPWPLRVVVPFMVVVGLPVLGLALLFGTIASTNPFDPLTQPADLYISGDLTVTPSQPVLRFGSGQFAKLTLRVANQSAQRTTLDIGCNGQGSSITCDRYSNVALAAGEARTFEVTARRTNPAYQGGARVALFVSAK